LSTFEESSGDALLSKAQELAAELKRYDRKIVFAESCTAGLLASSLSRVPGISSYFCGSMVTYRNATKSQWLGVDWDDLNSAEIGPVSEIVAVSMAKGVLQKTPEADIAVSVTGHLGPDAPENLDGIAFVAVLFRESQLPKTTKLAFIEARDDGVSLRQSRQVDAAIQAMQTILTEINLFL